MGKHDRCCVINCHNRRSKYREGGETLIFSSIPMGKSLKAQKRRKLWLQAIRRENFVPKAHSKVCGLHFVSGFQINDPSSIDYVPTLHLGCEKSVKMRVTSTRKKDSYSSSLEIVASLGEDGRRKLCGLAAPDIGAEITVGGEPRPLGKQFHIFGSLLTEMMPTRPVVSPKPSPRKDLVSAAESLLVLSSSSSVVDRWVKEEKQDADSCARSKNAEETVADTTVKDGVGPNLPTLKEEPFDLIKYQLNSQEPLAFIEPFNEIKPVFLSEVASEAESNHTYCQHYKNKHDLVEFKIELNPDWYQDDQDSERDNPLPNMATELDYEDIKPFKKDYTVKSENASGRSLSQSTQKSAEVQRLLHDESRQKIYTEQSFIKAHGLEKGENADCGVLTDATAMTSVSNGELNKSQKVIVMSAGGKVERCLTITQPSAPALNSQTILLVTPNAVIRQPTKNGGGRRIILLMPTGEKNSTSKDSGISHDLKVQMSHPDQKTTSSKEKSIECGGQKILPSAEKQQGVAEMPEKFSAGSSPLICKNCDARIEGQPTLVRHLLTCSTANGRLWPKSLASTNSVNQASSSTTCSSDQKPTAPKLTGVWVRPKDSALHKTDVLSSFEVCTGTRDRLKPPKEIMVEDEPYRCEVCDSLFRKLQDFRTHIQIHRKHEINLCPKCGKQFSRPSAFDNHMRTHGSERPFACDQCPKTFKYITCLKSHLHHHTGEKRFQCELCSKKFSSSAHLKCHRLTHTRDGPLKCPECPASFITPSVYKIHVRVHTGERPYPCKFCEKAFKDTSSLNLHLRIHMRDKPYKCHVCGATFQRPGGLKQHVMTHAGMSPYECSQCGIAFGSSGALKRHMQYHSQVSDPVKRLCD